MENFSFEHEGKRYWYSRSVVVGMFIFAQSARGVWHVLINKRGSGLPTNIGKWNAPGGYLDFDETVEQAACREAFEETGVDPSKYADIHFHSYNSEPTNSQNVSFKFYCKCPNTTKDGYLRNAPIMEVPLSTDNCEFNEVDEIRWVAIDDLKKYELAFNHFNTIMSIYKEFIKPSFKTKLKKFLRKL